MHFLCHFGSKNSFKMDPESDVESVFLSDPLPGASGDIFGDHFGIILGPLWHHSGTLFDDLWYLFSSCVCRIATKTQTNKWAHLRMFFVRIQFYNTKTDNSSFSFCFSSSLPTFCRKVRLAASFCVFVSVVIEVGQHIFPPTAFSDCSLTHWTLPPFL